MRTSKSPPPIKPASLPSTEFRFVAACCRRPSDHAVLRELTRYPLDGARIVAIATRHRVQGLVHAAVAAAGITLPPGSAGDLRQAAHRIAIQTIGQAGETRRLVGLADQQGLALVVLKGAPLAQLAYGSIALKHAADIDLAIAPADLDRARDLLRAAGYAPLPTRLAKDEPWRHAGRGWLVELHTRLFDSVAWLPALHLATPLRRVELGAPPGVPVLGDTETFAYLCAHGAKHGWSRLKWLADLAAYLATRSPAELTNLHIAATWLGVGRCAAQALLLCADLFGTPLDPAYRRALRRDPATRWLVREAYRSFTGRNETLEPALHGGTAARLFLAQFLLTPGWSAWRELLRARVERLRLGSASSKGQASAGVTRRT